LEKTTVLKEYVEYVYDNLGRTLEGLTVEEARWKPMPESNDVAYILRHMAKISNTYSPPSWAVTPLRHGRVTTRRLITA
jgi:hypothetical protein